MNTDNSVMSEAIKAIIVSETNMPYKLGGTDDPHFQDHTEELSRTEATCDWFDKMEAECNDFDRGDLRDEGRSDGQGESYAERQ